MSQGEEAAVTRHDTLPLQAFIAGLARVRFHGRIQRVRVPYARQINAVTGFVCPDLTERPSRVVRGCSAIMQPLSHTTRSGKWPAWQEKPQKKKKLPGSVQYYYPTELTQRTQESKSAQDYLSKGGGEFHDRREGDVSGPPLV